MDSDSITMEIKKDRYRRRSRRTMIFALRTGKKTKGGVVEDTKIWKRRESLWRKKDKGLQILNRNIEIENK